MKATGVGSGDRYRVMYGKDSVATACQSLLEVKKVVDDLVHNEIYLDVEDNVWNKVYTGVEVKVWNEVRLKVWGKVWNKLHNTGIASTKKASRGQSRNPGLSL